MDDFFEIPVTYKGALLSFTASLLQKGYIHQFRVEVNGQEVFFEQDDEGNYRALVDAATLQKNVSIDTALLQAIAVSIEGIVR